MKRNRRKVFSLEQKGEDNAERDVHKEWWHYGGCVAAIFTRRDSDEMLPQARYKHTQDGIEWQSVPGDRLASSLVHGHFNGI